MTPTTLRIVRRQRIVLACLFILGAVVVAGAAKGATVQVLTFSIDEMTTPPNAVFAVGADPYKDYRLSSGLSDPNYCVEASPDSSGFTFIRLDRKLDGDAGSQFCDVFGGTKRQYSLTIAAADACLELYTNGYAATSGSGCTFIGQDMPRIRLAKLFASKVTKTPVAFLSMFYDQSRVSYEVRTDSDATVTTFMNSTNNRMVRYTGTARLVKFSPGASATPVASSFPLPFHMTFVRSGL